MKLTPLIAGLAQAGALVLAGVLAMAMQFAAWAPSGAQPSGLPEGASIGFTLTTADGNAVSERTYRGKWLVVYFGYTSCPDVCPTTLMEIAGALEKSGPRATTVRALLASSAITSRQSRSRLGSPRSVTRTARSMTDPRTEASPARSKTGGRSDARRISRMASLLR